MSRNRPRIFRPVTIDSPTQVVGESGAWGWPLFLLRFAVCTLFLGRGVLYLSHFSPLSVFFWNQGWLERPLSWCGIVWEDYAATSEPLITRVQAGFGIVFIISAIACWWVQGDRHRWARWVVSIGMLGLLPYWLLKWVDKDYQFAMFIEHFLQWGTPLLLLLFWRLPRLGWFALAWVLISCTFVGHGLYAIGLGVPHSNDFVNMTMHLLGTGEVGARRFLLCVGWIDLFLPILFLIPHTRVVALAYAAFWGLGTALARILCHYTPAEDYYGLHPWTAECVVRLSHGLVPLVVLLLLLNCFGDKNRV